MGVSDNMGVPLKGSFKRLLEGYYKCSVKGLGFRASENNRGFPDFGVLILRILLFRVLS